MKGFTNNKIKIIIYKKKIFLEPPCTVGPKLLHGSIGTYRQKKTKQNKTKTKTKTKTKNENSDNVSITVKMCSSEAETNPYDF